MCSLPALKGKPSKWIALLIELFHYLRFYLSLDNRVLNKCKTRFMNIKMK